MSKAVDSYPLQKNMGKSFSSKYAQMLLDSATKPATDAHKTAPKRVIQKTADATGDFGRNSRKNYKSCFKAYMQCPK